jgi:hypothetical protein
VDYLICHILRIGGVLVCGGLVTLVVVIPLAGRIAGKGSTRTEFFSARAAFWCVMAGLAVLVLVSTGLAVRTALGGR